MADFEQTELGEFDGHRIGTGVSMLDGKPSRMVVTETPDGRLKGLLRLNYETKNLEPILSDGPEQPADLDD